MNQPETNGLFHKMVTHAVGLVVAVPFVALAWSEVSEDQRIAMYREMEAVFSKAFDTLELARWRRTPEPEKSSHRDIAVSTMHDAVYLGLERQSAMASVYRVLDAGSVAPDAPEEVWIQRNNRRDTFYRAMRDVTSFVEQRVDDIELQWARASRHH